MSDLLISGTCSFNIKMSTPEQSQAGVYVTTTMNNITTKGRAPMAYTLPDDRKVQVQISYVDSKGHPAQVDGDVAWSTSDEAIATVTADSTDSTKADIVPATNLGQVQIMATADADLGSGVQNIVTPFDVSVVAGMAVAGTIAPVGEQIPITK